MPAAQPDWIKSTLEIVATVIVVILGLGAITYSRRLAREREATSTPLSLMEEFQRAYDEGEMDEEEFRRVRDALTGRKKKQEPEPSPEPNPLPKPIADPPERGS